MCKTLGFLPDKNFLFGPIQACLHIPNSLRVQEQEVCVTIQNHSTPWLILTQVWIEDRMEFKI